MFDMLQRDAGGAGVPVPLPGRVMLFAGQGGAILARLSDGSVVPVGDPGPKGEPGESIVWGLGVGQYAALRKQPESFEPLLSVAVAVGGDVVSNGVNLEHGGESIPAVWTPVQAGQVWTLLATLTGAVGLFRRVS